MTTTRECSSKMCLSSGPGARCSLPSSPVMYPMAVSFCHLVTSDTCQCIHCFACRRANFDRQDQIEQADSKHATGDEAKSKLQAPSTALLTDFHSDSCTCCCLLPRNCDLFAVYLTEYYVPRAIYHDAVKQCTLHCISCRGTRYRALVPSTLTCSKLVGVELASPYLSGRRRYISCPSLLSTNSANKGARSGSAATCHTMHNSANLCKAHAANAGHFWYHLWPKYCATWWQVTTKQTCGM